MSFKISNIGSEQISQFQASKTLKLKKNTNNAPKPKEAAASSTLTKARAELGKTSEASIELQKDISSSQAKQEALMELQLKAQSRDIQEVKKQISEASFNGKPILSASNAATSDSESLLPVIVDNPPKIGSYTISILAKESSPDAIRFTIEVETDSTNQKSVTTSISPATGIIEGVDLYFEKEQERAQVNIKNPGQEFPIPDFSADIAAIEGGDNSRWKELDSKIESTLKGVDSELKTRKGKFQESSTRAENIRAASIDFDSLAGAFAAIKSTNDALKSNSASMQGLFNNSSLNQAKELLD